MMTQRALKVVLVCVAVLQSLALVYVYSARKSPALPAFAQQLLLYLPRSAPVLPPLGSGIEGVDAVYVLNLARRPDRRRRMRLLLDSLGIRPVFARAIDLTAASAAAAAYDDPAEYKHVLDLSLLPTKADFGAIAKAAGQHQQPNATTLFSAGSLGAWQSHVRIAGEICRLRQTALLLEDDVDVSYDLGQRVARLVRELPPRWRVVRLGTCGYDPLPFAAGGPVLAPDVWKSGGFSCIHALLLNAEGACALHAAADVAVPEHAVDILYRMAALESSPGIETFVVWPSIALQDPRAGSDIESSAPKRKETLRLSAAARASAVLGFKWNPADPLYVTYQS